MPTRAGFRSVTSTRPSARRSTAFWSASSAAPDRAWWAPRWTASRAVADLHFAWAGGTWITEPHYFRIQGPVTLVEFDNAEDDTNHVHGVWRDPAGDFGRERAPHCQGVARVQVVRSRRHAPPCGAAESRPLSGSHKEERVRIGGNWTTLTLDALWGRDYNCGSLLMRGRASHASCG